MCCIYIDLKHQKGVVQVCSILDTWTVFTLISCCIYDSDSYSDTSYNIKRFSFSIDDYYSDSECNLESDNCFDRVIWISIMIEATLSLNFHTIIKNVYINYKSTVAFSFWMFRDDLVVNILPHYCDNNNFVFKRSLYDKVASTGTVERSDSFVYLIWCCIKIEKQGNNIMTTETRTDYQCFKKC